MATIRGWKLTLRRRGSTGRRLGLPRLGLPRLRLPRLGLRRPRALKVPAVAGWTTAALAVPLAAVGVAAAVTGGHADPAPKPAFTQTPGEEPTLSPQEARDFEKAAQRPPAAPPMRRPPQIALPTIKVEGIPRVALGAYMGAARTLARTQPSCRIAWPLLAGIGLVESGHAHSGGSMRAGWDGIARPPILGPLLDGNGFAAIRDTDHGVYDGNTQWDRAVGPMQFIPSTWESSGADADGDHRRNPQDIRDAALAAGGYLCAAGADLSTPHGMQVAVYSYNHSFDYVRLVLSVAARYAGIDPRTLGLDALPSDSPAPSPSPSPTPRKAKAKPRTATSSPAPRPVTTTSGGSGGTAPTSSPMPTQPAPTLSTSPAPAPTVPLPGPTTSIGLIH